MSYKSEDVFASLIHDVQVGRIHELLRKYMAVTGPLTLEELCKLLEIDEVKLAIILSLPSISQSVKRHVRGKWAVYYLENQRKMAIDRQKARDNRPPIFSLMEYEEFDGIIAKMEEKSERGISTVVNGRYNGKVDVVVQLPDNCLILDQCKNEKGKVGPATVRGFIRAVKRFRERGGWSREERIIRGNVIKGRFYAASAFNEEAERVASQHPDIELIDGIGLIKRLERYGLLETLKEYWRQGPSTLNHMKPSFFLNSLRYSSLERTGLYL